MTRRMVALAALVLFVVGTACFSGRSQGPGVLTGYVYDDATGEGIPGADVALVPSDIAVRTGADGSFRIDSVPRGSYTIRVNVSGYQSGAVTGVEVSPGKVKWAKLFLKRTPGTGGG